MEMMILADNAQFSTPESVSVMAVNVNTTL